MDEVVDDMHDSQSLRAQSLIEIEHLSVNFENKAVLKDINLTVKNRRILAIIGPSGCGKTTLLRCINRLITQDRDAHVTGSVLLDGKEVSHMPLAELRKNVGLVFQEPSPFPFSIWRNVAYAPRYFGGLTRQQIDELVIQKLKLVGLYDEVSQDLKKNALKLSGGQQQRLCIARALASDPQVLLLDEPCSALDINATAIIEKALVGLKEQLAMVVVTHNIAQAQRIADDVVFMMDGEVIEAGAASQVLKNPQSEKTQAFLAGSLW